MSHMIHGKQVDLNADEARAALKACTHRVVDRPFPNIKGGWRHVEVFYDGKWMEMAREDLFGQVATGLPMGCGDGNSNQKWPADPFQWFMGQIIYGARITKYGRKWGFHVIDALTDG